MDELVSEHLASNVRLLREARGLTQQQIAKTAGVPRPTWAHLESGAANPTLQVLVKVAAALQVRVEELIGPPKAVAKHYAASTLPVRRRQTCTIRRLLPEALKGLEIERFELPSGAMFSGVPHTPGTREYLTCEVGELELRVSGTKYSLREGDVVVFRGDQKHGYRNPGRKKAIAYSVVAFSPG
ncbi:MAG: XRE family transcriptional regulator [Deltaproteobacteria bacterium]